MPHISLLSLSSKLRALAGLLDAEYESTVEALALLAAPGGSSGGQRQSGTHSDPTGSTVVSNERNRWVDRQRRFRLAVQDLRRVCVQLTHAGSPTVAGYALALACHVEVHGATPQVTTRLARIVDEIEAAIYDAAPIDADTAKLELRAVTEAAAENVARQPCLACDSPPGAGSMRRGVCEKCSSVMRKANSFRDTPLSPAELRERVLLGVRSGTMRREHSPHLTDTTENRELIRTQEIRVGWLTADWFTCGLDELARVRDMVDAQMNEQVAV